MTIRASARHPGHVDNPNCDLRGNKREKPYTQFSWLLLPPKHIGRWFVSLNFGPKFYIRY